MIIKVTNFKAKIMQQHSSNVSTFRDHWQYENYKKSIRKFRAWERRHLV